MSDSAINAIMILAFGGIAYYGYTQCWFKSLNFAPTTCPNPPNVSPPSDTGPVIPVTTTNCPDQPDTPCPCGTTWNKTPILDPQTRELTCRCSQLTPSVINLPFTSNVNLNWTTHTSCAFVGILCKPVIGQFPCPTYLTPLQDPVPCGSSGDTQSFNITGTVTDHNGNPICNIPVDINLPDGSAYPWRTSVGNGNFIVTSSNSQVISDENGQIQIPITVQMTHEGWNGIACPGSILNTQQPDPKVIQLSIKTTIHGTSISGLNSVAIRNFICEDTGGILG